MVNPRLVLAAAVVSAVAVFVGAFVGLPLLFGWNVDLGLLVNALAALGSFAAAGTALWIATSDRKQRQQEQDESDRKQAGLVRVTTEWGGLGHPYGGARHSYGGLTVTVKNFGKLPVVDVDVTDWCFSGHGAVTHFVSTGPIEAVLPYTGEKTDTGHDKTAGVLEIRPSTGPAKIAIEGEPEPNVESIFGTTWKTPPAVNRDTGRTVTIQFTDAGEKRWRRSSDGSLERA